MSCVEGPTICFRAGAAEDFLGLVSEGVALTGTWLWNGTLTVVTDDTSGVSLGDEIRLEEGCPFFTVTGIAANASVTLTNPDKETIPTGTGVQLKTPLDLSRAVDGTADRPAIIIFEWRKGNTRIFKKTSYNQEEIQVLDQVTNPGQYLLLLDDPDTDAAAYGELYRYELAVARQDFLRSGAQGGTATIADNTNVLVGVGTSFTNAKRGDILHPTSGAVIDQPSRIIEITDNLNVVLERTYVTGGAGFSFEIRRGKTLPAQAGAGAIDPSEVRLKV